jgi:hypothetical protein
LTPIGEYPQQGRHNPDSDGGDPRGHHLGTLVHIPLPYQVDIEVVRDRAGGGERQTGDNGDDRRDCDGGDESEHDLAASGALPAAEVLSQ